MVTQFRILVSIFRHHSKPIRTYVVPPLAVVSPTLRHGPPCWPRSEYLPILARRPRRAPPWAYLDHLTMRVRRNDLFANDYFKDSVLGALSSAAGANIRISRGRRIVFVPKDDKLLPPIMAGGTRRPSDSFLQFLQAALE